MDDDVTQAPQEDLDRLAEATDDCVKDLGPPSRLWTAMRWVALAFAAIAGVSAIVSVWHAFSSARHAQSVVVFLFVPLAVGCLVWGFIGVMWWRLREPSNRAVLGFWLVWMFLNPVVLNILALYFFR